MAQTNARPNPQVSSQTNPQMGHMTDMIAELSSSQTATFTSMLLCFMLL